MIKNIKYLVFVLFVFAVFLAAGEINASENNLAIFSRFIDEETVKKGYEIKGFENKFQLAIFPQVLKSSSRIVLKNRTEIFLAESAKSVHLSAIGDQIASSSDNTTINMPVLFDSAPSAAANFNFNPDASSTADLFTPASSTNQIVPFDRASSTDSFASSTEESPEDPIKRKEEKILETVMAQAEEMGTIPAGWKINSEIYEFNVNDKSAFDGKKPLVITISYQKDTNNRQKVFYFDAEGKKWVDLPSMVMYNDKSVRSLIHLSYAKLAVFSHESIPSIGSASWYKYKGCNCAASPDYEKGTKLKVTNLASDKSVIITVNDYGPDRKIFPERVIDLDLEAFKAIAPKNAGVVKVKVEPEDEICSYEFQKAKHPKTIPPQIEAKYAIIIDEPTGEILYKKDETEKTSLASITKLMTAQIFFEQNPDSQKWNKVVKYRADDDSEGAKLYVEAGENMTLKDLFYSMLIGSANNAAKALVRNSGLGEKQFIERMNQKAKEWNLTNTEFHEVSGLDPDNKSTAQDIALMAKNVFKNLEMLKATTMKKYSFQTINTQKAHIIKNTNKLLNDSDLYITGGKTGYLEEAGECLVLKAKNKNDGREVIGVVMGEETNEKKFDDMKKMMQWALQ